MQEAPVAPTEAPEAEGEEGGGIISNISQGIGMIAEKVGQQNPEAGQALMQLNDQFQKIMQSVMGQGEAAPQGPAAGSPEAGGASGAMPAGPQGAVR